MPVVDVVAAIALFVAFLCALTWAANRYGIGGVVGGLLMLCIVAGLLA